jgi:hypothetical protein
MEMRKMMDEMLAAFSNLAQRHLQQLRFLVHIAQQV